MSQTKVKVPTLAERDAAQRIVLAYRDHEAKQEAEANRQLIGRFFRYRNSGGSDYPKEWWLYAAITGVNKRGTIKGYTFQTMSDGLLQLEKKQFFGSRISPNYQEITPKHFLREAQKFRSAIASSLHGL